MRTTNQIARSKQRMQRAHRCAKSAVLEMENAIAELVTATNQYDNERIDSMREGDNAAADQLDDLGGAAESIRERLAALLAEAKKLESDALMCCVDAEDD